MTPETHDDDLQKIHHIINKCGNHQHIFSKLFQTMENNIGPIVEPCGTPTSISTS